jgi:UDP-N-acetyl-D-mannosaminuronic acid dehydrogenase
VEKMKIAVVGLGNAGLPLAAVIADKGFKVVGVDVDARRCDQINKGINPIPEEPELNELIKKHGGKTLVATSQYKDAVNCNFYIVIVPLFIDDDHQPDFKFLESAFRNIGKILKKGDCVVLETTVPPKTTETVIKKWLEEESGLVLGDFYLAYSPERIMTGYSISRLKEFPKIVGGVDTKSGKKAFEVYKNFIPNLSLVSSSRAAEFIKVIEGCYRSTNIALANELFKIADELNIDFFEAREYANHKYCDIHMPSTGVGGHCIPAYPWFLVKEMEKRGKSDYSMLQEISLKINNEMINTWAEKIIDESKKLSKPLNEIKICVKGITFREGVKSLYYSRNLALVKLLEKKGLDVYVYDDLFSESEIKKENLRFANPDEVDVVFDAFTLEILK